MINLQQVIRFNLNLYSDADGNNKFKVKVTDQGVSVSSDKPITFPEINVGTVVSVDQTIRKLRTDVNAEVVNRGKSFESERTARESAIKVAVDSLKKY